ncbi:MAG: ATP-binding protein [Deltaproteobacteria bacterium]|nr:ATP-binding protein [Deltaproteobacteria bacterium]
MADYKEGIKKEVAEIKFLIHDLRVERFINDVIHFHVTLDTDLEIYSVDQAQAMHGEDLQVLKAQAAILRKAFQDYSNAVKNFSPDRTILLTGRKYIDTIYSICELILNPLWGRIDKVLDFLPPDSRSVCSRLQYRNCVNWIAGVRRRIRYFLDEEESGEVCEEFDVAAEIEDLTRNVIQGYVAEKGAARVELQLGQLDSAVLYGNLPRFRRMYFNLIMNAVDAMSDQKVGILRTTELVGGDRVVLQVRDDGAGMTQEKRQVLLTDRETLDGDLHSLGFVFVRQTIDEFQGELSIDSELGKGTTITIRFPYLPGKTAVRQSPSSHEEYGFLPSTESAPRQPDAPAAAVPAPSGAAAADGVEGGQGMDGRTLCGNMIFEDYQASRAQFPGSIFAIAITEDDEVDCFTHRAYERHWNITHEDLAPMLFQSTIRGRLEEDEEKTPVLILKPPHSLAEYFELKEVPQGERSPAKHLQMVHDEYIRVARKLIATGMPPQIGLLLADAPRYFPEGEELQAEESFPLEMLAGQRLASEEQS